MKRIIIIAIIAVLVIGGALGYYFLIYRANADQTVKLTPYSPGEYFITNIKDSNRLLKTTIVLGLDNEKLVETFTNDNAMIRDTIIFILRDLTEEEVRAVGVEEKIREQIQTALNEKMQTESIIDIWFNDFVMQ